MNSGSPGPAFLSQKLVYKQPVLTIVRQPQKRGYRFRYASEGLTHGGIRGEPKEGEREEKIFPSIKISGYRGRAKVVVTIVTANDKNQETRLHAHSLVVDRQETKGYHVFPLDGQDPSLEMTTIAIQHIEKKQQEAKLMDRILQTQFLQKCGWSSSMVEPGAHNYSDLVAFAKALEDRDEKSKTFVDRVTNTEVTNEKLARLQKEAKALAKSMDMSKCRLCFQAFCQDSDGHFSVKLEPVYSDVIYDGKTAQGAQLKIMRISKVASVVTGNEEVWVIGDKLNPDDIEVRFFEDKPSPQYPNGWESFGIFNKTDVFKQIVLIFKTPEYYNKDIDQPVEVSLELRRKSDRACTSDAQKFKYTPNKDPYGLGEKRKKANPLDVMFRKTPKMDQEYQGVLQNSLGMNMLNNTQPNTTLLNNGNLYANNFPIMALMTQPHPEQLQQQQFQQQQQEGQQLQPLLNQQQQQQQLHQHHHQQQQQQQRYQQQSHHQQQGQTQPPQQPQLHQQQQTQPQRQQQLLQQQHELQPRKEMQEHSVSLPSTCTASFPSTGTPVTNGVVSLPREEMDTIASEPLPAYSKSNTVSTVASMSNFGKNSHSNKNIKTEDENYNQATATVSSTKVVNTSNASVSTNAAETLQELAPKTDGLTNSMIMVMQMRE